MLTTSERPRGRSVLPYIVALAFLPGLIASTGCTNLIKSLVVLLHDPRTPAEFDDLKNKSIAVITTSEGSSTSDASAIVMTQHFKNFLSNNLKKKITFASQEDANRAFHDQPFEGRNYADIARQLEVDYVIAIDISNLKLKDGPTLYQGNCDCKLAVYDPEQGNRPVFTKDLSGFIQPGMGKPITDCTEAQFQGHYLGLLAWKAARIFYKWDPVEEAVLDATAI
jgi:hypothetical protein